MTELTAVMSPRVRRRPWRAANETVMLSCKLTRVGMFTLHVGATNDAGSVTTPLVIVVF